MSEKNDWVAEKQNDILRINIPYRAATDWEQWVLLRSDAHWDNVKSDRALMKLHLEQAKERNAIVLDGGDLFCAMQGKGDPRSSKNALRPEHSVTNYLDSLVNTAAKWHMPYKDNIAMLAHGNHELSVYDRKETDLTDRLAYKLDCVAMPISGFVKFRFFSAEDSAFSYLLHYHHGYGGGGPVTQDMIQAHRKGTYTHADIVWSGHTHDAWTMYKPLLHVTDQGKVMRRLQHHVKTPTYKDDYNAGKSGWANLKGHHPKPLGAVWLRFCYYTKQKTEEDGTVTKTSRRVNLQVIPDIHGNKLEGE